MFPLVAWDEYFEWLAGILGEGSEIWRVFGPFSRKLSFRAGLTSLRGGK